MIFNERTNERTKWDWNWALSDAPANKQYGGIDIVKFLCAFLVVAIHIPVFGDISGYVDVAIKQYIARVAVPFYFTAAGFFLFRKVDPNHIDSSIFIDYLSKRVFILGVWTVLLFKGGTGQLWFISGLVVATVMVWLMMKAKLSLHIIILISCFLYFIGLLGQPYDHLFSCLDTGYTENLIYKAFHKLFSTTRNGFFFGTPFMVIGMLFAYRPIKMKAFWAIGGCTASVLLFFGEVVFLFKADFISGSDLYLMLLPVVFFLFYIASHIQVRNIMICRWLRSMGMLIYYLHLLVYAFVSLGLSIIEKYCHIHVTHSLIQYIVTITITTVMSWFIVWLSNKEKYSWIKKLYT